MYIYARYFSKQRHNLYYLLIILYTVICYYSVLCFINIQVEMVTALLKHSTKNSS